MQRPIVMIALLLAATVSSSLIDLRIQTDKPSLAVGEWAAMRASIHSRAKTTVNLIDVLDGSAWHWTNPKVGWSVVSGRAKHPSKPPKTTLPRCGNVNPLVARDVFELSYGETRDLSVQWAPLTFDTPGIYRVKFYYSIDKALGLGKLDMPESTQDLKVRYRQATPIELVSNELTITVR